MVDLSISITSNNPRISIPQCRQICQCRALFGIYQCSTSAVEHALEDFSPDTIHDNPCIDNLFSFQNDSSSSRQMRMPP